MRPKVRKGIEGGMPRVEETQEQGKRQDHGQRETGSSCASRVIWFHSRSLSGKLRPIQDSRKACGSEKLPMLRGNSFFSHFHPACVVSTVADRSEDQTPP